MKEYINFEAILSFVFFLLAVLALRSNLKRKKQLGEMVYPTLTGVRHSDFVMQTILIFFMFLFVILSAVFNAQAEKNYLLFFIIFPVALIVYLANNLLQVKTPKGLYEHGVYTSNGIILYDEIVKYDTISMQSKNYTRFRINPRSTFLSSNSYLDVAPGEEGPLKAQLKKKAAFKKKTYTPPPKKKRRS
jgi:hypothetical protein